MMKFTHLRDHQAYSTTIKSDQNAIVIGVSPLSVKMGKIYWPCRSKVEENERKKRKHVIKMR